jgi:hypothetical protein
LSIDKQKNRDFLDKSRFFYVFTCPLGQIGMFNQFQPTLAAAAAALRARSRALRGALAARVFN